MYESWSKPGMVEHNNSADFSSWLAQELTTIRVGIDKLGICLATLQERMVSTRDDVSRLAAEVTEVKKDVSLLKMANVTKDSAWLGFWKLVAIVPIVASAMAIMFYLVNLGLLDLSR